MENSFEKRIADKLKNTEVQPSENLLDSIFEKRAAKPKRFAVYPFAGVVLGIVLIVSLGFWYWGKGSKSTSISSNVVLERESPKSQAQETNKPEQIIAETNATKEDVSQKTVPMLKPKKRNAESSVKASSSSNRGQEIVVKRDNNIAKTTVNNAGIDNQYFNVGKGERPLIQKSEHQGNSHLYVYETIGDDALVNRDFLFSRVVRLSKMSINKNIETIEMVDNKPVKRNGHSKNKRPIYLDFMFNPSVNMMLLSGDNSLVEAGKAVSKASLNQGFGFRISIPVSSKWNVFTGLNYREQSNLYKGQLDYNAEHTQINQHIKYINDPIKGVVKIVTYDTVNSQVTNSQNVNFKNQYKIFQLPLGLSYNFGYKKFDFSINGSALFNYIKSSQGQNINLDQHIVLPYSSSKGTLGFGAGLSVMGAYKLSNRIRLIAEPGFQYFGLKSNHFGNKIDEKVLSPQLSLGIRYTLF
jgi:hypothetical protein